MDHNRSLDKRVLGICGRTDILQKLEDEIKTGFPKCRFDQVATPGEGRRLMMLFKYHLIIIGNLELKEFLGAGFSMIRNYPLVVLTRKHNSRIDRDTIFTLNVYGYLFVPDLEKTLPVLSLLMDVEFIPRWQYPLKRHGGIFNLGTVEAAEKLICNQSRARKFSTWGMIS